MSPLLSALLLAATATAQLTTSIRMPSPYQDDTHIGFLASVVAVSGDKTTLALHFDNATNLRTAGYLIDHKPNTMTFQPSAFEAVSTIPASAATPASTVTYGCSFASPRSASAGGICSFVSDGPGLHASACAPYASAASAPAYCKDGSDLPESLRAHTYAIEDQDIATYQVVITAGTEKLSATAGATPSAGSPAPTGTLASLHRGQNVVPVETGAPAPAAATGAAGALFAVHPVVLGVGALALGLLV